MPLIGSWENLQNANRHVDEVLRSEADWPGPAYREFIRIVTRLGYQGVQRARFTGKVVPGLLQAAAYGRLAAAPIEGRQSVDQARALRLRNAVQTVWLASNPALRVDAYLDLGPETFGQLPASMCAEQLRHLDRLRRFKLITVHLLQPPTPKQTRAWGNTTMITEFITGDDRVGPIYAEADEHRTEIGEPVECFYLPRAEDDAQVEGPDNHYGLEALATDRRAGFFSSEETGEALGAMAAAAAQAAMLKRFW